MVKRFRLLTPLALLLILSVAIAGCSAGQQVTATDVIAKMRETMKTVQTSQGTADLSLTINKAGLKALAGTLMPGAPDSPQGEDWTSKLPDTVSASIKTWKQSPDKLRVEVVSSSIPGTSGAALVYDGQKFYALDPTSKNVYSGTPEKMMDKMPAEMKSMMQGIDLQAQIDKLLDAADITLVGTEKIAGVDAYKLDIKPKADAADKLDIPQMMKAQVGILLKDAHMVLWVDKDRWIPLKVTLEHPNMGTFTGTMTTIELNKPIDPSEFVIQVPAGGKVVDIDSMADNATPKAGTLPEARNAAQKDGWKLLEPSYVPDNATLIEVLNTPSGMGKDMMGGPGSAAGIILNYSSPTTNFSIMEGKGEYQGMLGDGFSGVKDNGQSTKIVTVRGVEATAFSPDGSNWTALFWKEKDSGVWVAIHGKLSLDEAQKIAEGLR